MTVARRRAILPTRLRRESSHMDKTPARRAVHAELDPTAQISGLRKLKLTSRAPVSGRARLAAGHNRSSLFPFCILRKTGMDAASRKPSFWQNHLDFHE
jgi:hypothetical protein